jgi:hypothetical protein
MTNPKPFNTATQKIKMVVVHFIVAWTGHGPQAEGMPEVHELCAL